MQDIFISYHPNNQDWADWVLWHINDAGMSVSAEPCSIDSGKEFSAHVTNAFEKASKLIILISPDYLELGITKRIWNKALSIDPLGRDGVVIPLMVWSTDAGKLPKDLKIVSLVGLDESVAKQVLLEATSHRVPEQPAEPNFEDFMAEEAAGNREQELHVPTDIEQSVAQAGEWPIVDAVVEEIPEEGEPEPEPISEPEMVQEPEPVVEPEPLFEPEPVEEIIPASEPESEFEPEPEFIEAPLTPLQNLLNNFLPPDELISVETIGQAISLIQKTYGTSIKAAGIFHLLGRFAKDTNELDNAVNLFRRAGRIRLRKFGANDLRTVSCLHELALVFQAQGKHKKALSYLAHCLTHYRNKRNKQELATCLNNLGSVYLSMQKWKHARKHLKAALHYYDELEANKTVPAAKALVNLGTADYHLHNFEEAIHSLEKAKATFFEQLGPDDEQTHYVERVLDEVSHHY